MAVIEKEKSTQEKSEDAASQELREKDLTKKIIGNLDLPTSLADAVDEAAGKKREEKEGEEEDGSEDKSEEKSEDDEKSEDAEDGKAETDDGEEGDEKLSPDSKKKAQKRIDELTREKNRLKAENERLRKAAPEQKAEEETDADTRTLSKLADRPDALEKLNSLRDDVLLAFKKETDPVKEKEYLALSKKIDRAIASVPQRFAGQQLSKYQEAVRETYEEFGGEEVFTEKVAGEIHDIAKAIYQKSSTFRGSITGQAEAWRLAVERYQEKQKSSSDKSKTIDLKRENNTLKKKVALDVGAQKSNTDKAKDARSFERAKHGNSDDKTDFIKKRLNTDSLIPEEYRVKE